MTVRALRKKEMIMTTEIVAETDFAGSLREFHAAAMDCIQVNLAVRADQIHGSGTHLRLGAPLRFDTRPLDGADGAADEEYGGLPTVEQTLRDRLAESGDLLGLAIDEIPAPACGAELAARCHLGRPLYVVGDAFALPWCPYFGQQHMEHGFLAVAGPAGDRGSLTVLDAYHNDTEWGPARPTQYSWPLNDLITGIPGRELRTYLVTPRQPATPPSPADNLAHLTAPPAAARNAYVQAYRDHPDQRRAMERLALETWLLSRSRELHARWLATGGQDSPAAGRAVEHAGTWARLAEQVYVALRRVRRGRPAPDVYGPLAELLAGDMVLAEQAAAPRGAA